jgi:hypothetical protein
MPSRNPLGDGEAARRLPGWSRLVLNSRNLQISSATISAIVSQIEVCQFLLCER